MSLSICTKVIIGFEVKPGELNLSPMPAHHCPEGHIRKGKDDKFCAICGGKFKADPKPPPSLIERYAEKIGLVAEELFDDWHEGYEDSEVCLREVAGDMMVLGKAWASLHEYKMGQLRQLDPNVHALITYELVKIRDDLGWSDRPINSYLVLKVS